MTQPDLRAPVSVDVDTEKPLWSHALDRLHEWRWWLLAVALLITGVLFLSGVSIPWGLVGIGLTSMLIAIGAATPFALPIALRRTNPPEEIGLLVLDPKHPKVRIRVVWMDPQEADDLTVRWGSIIEARTLHARLWLVLAYDPDRGAVWGTHRSTKDPDEMVRHEHRLDEFYGEQEKEAARAQALEANLRVGARRASQAIVREQDKAYDQATIPKGGAIDDVLDDLTPDVKEVDDREDVVSVPDELEHDDMAGSPEPAATDGGTDAE